MTYWDDTPRNRWELFEAIQEEESIWADTPSEFVTLHQLQLEQLVVEHDGQWSLTDHGWLHFLRMQPQTPASLSQAEPPAQRPALS